MPSCVFRKCNTYTGPAVKCKKDVSFHLFPKDGLMKDKWVQVVRTQRREDDWMPTTYSTIGPLVFEPIHNKQTKFSFL